MSGLQCVDALVEVCSKCTVKYFRPALPQKDEYPFDLLSDVIANKKDFIEQVNYCADCNARVIIFTKCRFYFIF